MTEGADSSREARPTRVARAKQALRWLVRRGARVPHPEVERTGVVAPAGNSGQQPVENWADDPVTGTPSPYADVIVVQVDENGRAIDGGILERTWAPDRSWTAASVDMRRYARAGIWSMPVSMASGHFFAETTKEETLLLGGGAFLVLTLVGAIFNAVRLRRRRRR